MHMNESNAYVSKENDVKKGERDNESLARIDKALKLLA